MYICFYTVAKNNALLNFVNDNFTRFHRARRKKSSDWFMTTACTNLIWEIDYQLQ